MAKSAPVFTLGLVDCKTKDGNAARFVCRVNAIPVASIHWYKDDKILKESRQFSFLQDVSTHTLIITETKQCDVGLYKCVATNNLGSASSSANLSIEEFQGVEDDANDRDCVVDVNAKPVEIVRGKASSCYTMKEELGRGKFGVVKKCIHVESGKEYAAKFITCRSKSSRDVVVHEVNVMNKLNHKRLLRLQAVFESDKEMVLIMELITGGELFEKLVQEEFISEATATLYMKQLLDGLEYMHSKNVLHLDLKPENMMLIRPGSKHIKIIDYGLAQNYDPNTKLQVMQGTPEFAAPEIVAFEDITPATDVWSVGVITYVILSGLSPFLGDDDTETMSNISEMLWDFDDPVFDDMTDEAKDFISKILVRNSSKRMTLNECQKHPWLRVKSDKKLETQRLKTFTARRKWKKALTAVRSTNFLSRILNKSGKDNKESGASAGKGGFLAKIKQQIAAEDAENTNESAKEVKAKAEDGSLKVRADEKPTKSNEKTEKKVENNNLKQEKPKVEKNVFKKILNNASVSEQKNAQTVPKNEAKKGENAPEIKKKIDQKQSNVAPVATNPPQKHDLRDSKDPTPNSISPAKKNNTVFQPSKDHPSTNQSLKNPTLTNQPSKNQPSKNQTSTNQPSKNPPLTNQPSKNPPLNNPPLNNQPSTPSGKPSKPEVQHSENIVDNPKTNVEANKQINGCLENDLEGKGSEEAFFIESLQNQTVIKWSALTLTAKIEQTKINPKIVWKKDGKTISPGRAKITYDKGLLSLKYPRVEQADCGKYSVEVTSGKEKHESSSHVKVEAVDQTKSKTTPVAGKNALFANFKQQQTVALNSKKSDEKIAVEMKKETPHVVEKIENVEKEVKQVTEKNDESIGNENIASNAQDDAEFIEKLQDQHGKKWSVVTLTAKIKEPTVKPKITWKKDGKVVGVGRAKAMYDKGIATLKFARIEYVDSGLYSVEFDTGSKTFESSATIEVSDIPDPPFPPNATEIRSTSMKVSWRPSNTGNSPIVAYYLEYRANSDKDWSTVDVTSTPYVLEDLTPKTQYKFRVSATNKLGTSKPSRVSSMFQTKV